MSPSPPSKASAPAPRTAQRLLAAGAIAATVGLAVAATAPVAAVGPPERIQAQQTIGGAALVIGWLLLGFAIHRLGREAPR